MPYNAAMIKKLRTLGAAPVRRLLITSALAAPFLLATTALARAGGGEGFSGGGGGGHGGGGGIFWILFYWIDFCINYPLVGVPITLVVLLFVAVFHRWIWRVYQTGQLQSGIQAMGDNTRQSSISILQNHDPAFNEAAFYQRVTAAFLIIQDTWCKQNMERARPFISDGIYERFTLQFREQRDENYHDQMDRIQVKLVRLAAMYYDHVFDCITVAIEATAVDYRVALSNNQPLPGPREDAPFVEYWTFLRRLGAKTLDKAGLIEGHCPNCGAPIAMNATAICQSCHAILRSGQYDWVLTEITQESEFRARQPQDLPGVAELRQSDPDFNVADLEDSTSVMFWRKELADRLGKIDPLKKVASPEFCQNYEPRLRPDSTGQRRYVSDCAVGAVRTLGVAQTPQQTLAMVEVRWSGMQMNCAVGGKQQPTGQGVVGHTLFVAMRQAGVKTNANMSISSAHCPNCGAPITDDAADTCSFCGAVLNDGSRSWALAEVWPMSTPQAQKLLSNLKMSVATQMLTGNYNTLSAAISSHAALAAAAAGGAAATPAGDGASPAAIIGGASIVAGSPPLLPHLTHLPGGMPLPETSGLVAWMVNAVVQNQALQPAEETMLMRVAENRNVSADRLKIMITAAQSGQLHAPQPMDGNQAQNWLGSMITQALADGGVDSQESQLFTTVGAKYGLSGYDVNQLVRRCKSNLIARGREARAVARATGAQ